MITSASEVKGNELIRNIQDGIVESCLLRYIVLRNWIRLKRGCHFSRGLIVTQSEAYKYYSDIEKYPERYPRYYQYLDVIERTNGSLTAKIFLNVNLSILEDHANITAKYTLIPEKEIKYEVINGPGKGIIENSLIIRGQDTLRKIIIIIFVNQVEIVP